MNLQLSRKSILILGIKEPIDDTAVPVIYLYRTIDNTYSLGIQDLTTDKYLLRGYPE
jgi:hypothetical protein